MDERVAMAISHWSPRFTAQGVTAGGFARITGGLERWADCCAAWSEVAAEHEHLGRGALAADREISAGAHLAQAAVYVHFATPLPDRRLGCRETRRHDPAAGGGPRVSGRAAA